MSKPRKIRRNKVVVSFLEDENGLLLYWKNTTFFKIMLRKNILSKAK
jgi:hypothetical protein